MSFTLTPAVDVAGGRAVRLIHGEIESEAVWGDARDAALFWQAEGAEWIRLVDIDAAFGRGSNAELIAEVIGELDINVELAGGIRDDASLESALSTGCARINLATAAVEDALWCARVIAQHGDRIAVALDVRVVSDVNGIALHRLAARGGTSDSGELWPTLAWLDAHGCERYVVTDVGKDGTLRGPNMDLYRAVDCATTTAVIASGGISSLDDLVLLAEASISGSNLEGAIVGKALYTGRFSVAQALDAIRGVVGDAGHRGTK